MQARLKSALWGVAGVFERQALGQDQPLRNRYSLGSCLRLEGWLWSDLGPHRRFALHPLNAPPICQLVDDQKTAAKQLFLSGRGRRGYVKAVAAVCYLKSHRLGGEGDRDLNLLYGATGMTDAVCNELACQEQYIRCSAAEEFRAVFYSLPRPRRSLVGVVQPQVANQRPLQRASFVFRPCRPGYLISVGDRVIHDFSL